MGPMSVSAPRPASSATRPGWGSMATSGGFFPSMRVPRMVAMSSPVDVYFTVAPVAEVNPSRTAWKLACSSPDHVAATSNDWPFSEGSVVAVLWAAPVLDADFLLLLPQLAPTSARTASRAAIPIAGLRDVDSDFEVPSMATCL